MAPMTMEQKSSKLGAFAMGSTQDMMFVAGAVLAAVVVVQVLFYLRKKTKAAFLKPDLFQPLTLVEKTHISPNTVRLRFSLPGPDMRLGLPIGQHITFCARDEEDKDFYRPYTPVSDDEQLGSVDFVIKLYPTGKMSQVIAKMEYGSTMLMKGPRGRFTYERNQYSHIGMIAGGSGITPMYQVINMILKDPKDKTKLSLIYGNVTESDILLRSEMEQLRKMHPDRLSILHVLNTAPAGWTGGVGFVTRDQISTHLHAPGVGIKVLLCGPPPMINAMKGHLDELKYSEDMQFIF